jgi:hypothetical protein
MQLKRGMNVCIHFEKNNEEWRRHGEFVSMDDDSVTIKGTVGEDIGRRLMFLKSRIIYIDFDPRRGDPEDV